MDATHSPVTAATSATAASKHFRVMAVKRPDGSGSGSKHPLLLRERLMLLGRLTSHSRAD